MVLRRVIDHFGLFWWVQRSSTHPTIPPFQLMYNDDSPIISGILKIRYHSEKTHVIASSNSGTLTVAMPDIKSDIA